MDPGVLGVVGWNGLVGISIRSTAKWSPPSTANASSYSLSGEMAKLYIYGHIREKTSEVLITNCVGLLPVSMYQSAHGNIIPP